MIGRRQLLTGIGSTFALAACTRAPHEEIVPYAKRPPESTPGIARYYATADVLDGYATGIVVETHEGRPTKVEGNPDHPASLGATSPFEQALIVSLYDGRRREGDDAAWAELRSAQRVHIALEPSSSPTVERLLGQLRPGLTVSFHGAGMPVNAWEGSRRAFGRVLEPRYDLSHADVIVALDADFLAHGPQRLRLARQLADRRTPSLMNRLYAIGPLVGLTASIADHHIAIRASDVGAKAREIMYGIQAARGDALVRDLLRARGRSLVIAGDRQPPEVHAIAYAINVALGNVGTTIMFAPSAIVEAGNAPSLPSDVDLLVVATQTPPAIPARKTLRFGAELAAAHPLESWGDARAFDGTVSIIQPLIAPLTGGKTVLDLLAIASGNPESAHGLVRMKDDREWRRSLKRGIVDDTAIPTVDVRLVEATYEIAPAPAGLELINDLDLRVHDGRFDENPWLCELQQPLTTLTWMNAALISAALAAKHGLEEGDEIAIDGGISEHTNPDVARALGVRAPVMVIPGMADDSIGLTLGWGRKLSRGVKTGISISKTGKKIELPITQVHHRLEGRDEEIAQHRRLGDRPKPRKKPLTLYTPPAAPPRVAGAQPTPAPRWGMAIDLTRCIGCDACMVACQAENNVPTVGAEQVKRGRVMYWLRVDTYYTEEGPITQPMLCQHCEKAPCEYVCPVGATSHSPDGINEMTYNRCVGTRFCSNNCPYKVRRFNWFDWHHGESKTEQLAHNPDVTVRERGVMEKCTFCVQRIHAHTPVTACQQACPAGAIVFGDLANAASPVARLHADERAFAALEDLGTEPRVRYLARIRNPNPEIA